MTAPIDLPSHDVHLWMTSVDDRVDTTLLDEYRALLSPAEAAQGARFMFDKDRRRFLVTRALVRTVLSRYAPAVAPRAWAFEANEHGCPRAANAPPGLPPIVFNLSHTDGLVVLCVRATHAVGVDVERWGRHTNLDVADHFFRPAEAAALRRLPGEAAQRERFMELWTFKESYIKARRKGLSIPLDQFEFELDDDPARVSVSFPGLDDRPARWHFRQVRPVPEHVVAVCAERDGDRVPALRACHVLPLRTEPAWTECPATRSST